MDKRLVEAIKAKMPKFDFNELITHPGGGAPTFSFLAGVQAHMQELEEGRFQDVQRKGMVIPKYDPFMDHVTSLIVNDYKVQVRLGIGRFMGKFNLTEIYGDCHHISNEFDTIIVEKRGLTYNPFTTWAK